ncbi:zinc finger CCHC domain-containing protein 3-like [Lytechinus variegatus]|uniref:zinc finger CCHC domain-containing protein 3-like n=1 Tax=Lytechinus variegatus TaxID=7654 RepID=UPI001BB291E2|nr:zinc finger CCHC domain-containing protein 3-like [Lytechinus variegatus]
MQRVRRECSVRVEFQKEESVFVFLKKNGVKIEDHLTAVQSLPGGKLYDVTFKTVALRREFQSVMEKEKECTVSAYCEDTKIITILHVPFEANDSTVRYILSRFGKVLDGRMLAHREFPHIFNGTRQYKIKLEKDIPSSLMIEGRDCWVRYEGQPRTCLKCKKAGHEAKDCTVTRCYRCDREGHIAQNCKEEMKCTICGEEGHGFRACPVSFAARLKISSTWASVKERNSEKVEKKEEKVGDGVEEKDGDKAVSHKEVKEKEEEKEDPDQPSTSGEGTREPKSSKRESSASVNEEIDPEDQTRQKSIFDDDSSGESSDEMTTEMSWAEETAGGEGKRSPVYISPSPLFDARETKKRRQGRRGIKRQSTSLSPKRK